ncbi:MAG TPA: hypothetical protein PKV73_12500, partial [Agriterribacter sp.]|nr:hypothetical protein [Agriterribacter sp.]
MKFLRKLLFIVLLTVPVKTIFSQEDYYIYIESLNHQPFYVRIGHETFTSSGNGYLLVPGLTSNTYDLIVGFPGVNISEWHFSLPVANKDLGFVLEEKGSKAPRLSYMDQKQALTGSAVKQKKEETREVTLPQGVTSNDPFSTLLAAVVNDPTIRMPVLVEAISIPPAVATQPDSVKAFVADTVSIVQQKDLAAVTSPVTPPEKAADQKIKEEKRETIQEQTPPAEKESKSIVKSETKPPVENKEEKGKTAIAVPVEKESKSLGKSETKPPVENKDEKSKEAIAVRAEKESKSLVKSETKPPVENKEEKSKTAIAVPVEKESKSLVKSETKP